ncbi:MAG: TRAP transporter substrate-binding protein DctP [Thermodesulfobacteriota bacterium]
MPKPRTAVFPIVFLCLILLASAAGADDTQMIGDKDTAKQYWKTATLAPKGIGYSRLFEEILLPVIQEETKGDLALKVYWGGVMGDDEQVIKKMRVGQLQGAGLSGQGTFLLSPEIPVLGLPFLFNSYEEVDFIKEKMIDTFDGIVAKEGFKVLLWLDQDFDQIYSAKVPVQSAADFPKARFITWFGPLEGRILELLGANPVPMGVTEIPSSMRAGVADAMMAPAIWVAGTQLYSVFRYVNPIRIRYVPGFVVVTTEAWNGAPEKHRKRLYELRLPLAKKFCTRSRQESDRFLAAIISYGLKEVKSTPEQTAKIKELTTPVWNELAGKLYSKALLDEILGYLKEYRASHPQACPAK